MPSIRTEEKNGVLVVRFEDTKILDEARIQQIGEELIECVSRATDKKLLLNFQGVSFMSSAMIGKLVLLHKKCNADGITMKLCGIIDNVMEVFSIMRLNRVFDIQPSEEKALKSFESKGWFK